MEGYENIANIANIARDTEVSTHPSYSPASPCDALGCDLRQQAIYSCVAKSCPYRWQRISAADRAARARADAKEAEAEG